MKKKKKSKKIKIIFISIFVLALISFSFLYFINDNRSNNIIFNMTKDLSASISNIISIPYNKINVNNSDLSKEINKDYERQIEELKKVLELNSTMSDKTLINAKVVKRSTNYWYNIVTIDKGKLDGVTKDLAVINSSGLIGKIIKVNNHSSDVKLLTSKNNNYISAVFYIGDNPYYGLIEEYDIKQNKLYLKNVIGDFNEDEIKNFNVTTSGLSDSFSSGLLIGKITSLIKETYGISNTIVITPSANFNDIKIVTVVGDKK